MFSSNFRRRRKVSIVCCAHCTLLEKLVLHRIEYSLIQENYIKKLHSYCPIDILVYYIRR